MRITTFSLGPLGTNSYVFDNGSEALAIDVGGDPAPMVEFLEQNGLKLAAILITHMHFDHLYGVAALQKALNVPAYVPAGDEPISRTEASLGGIWGMPPVPGFKETPFTGDFTAGSFSVHVLQTPGHTPGGVSFHFPEAGVVFTGDSLFYRSIGRTDFPMGDHQTLLQSVHSKLFTLPDETVVYPGHGPESSIGDERRHNPFVGDFVPR
ncbi:MAG: MBL fold metallo-hydrolase [Desulfovibrionaceae bacterium]|nr:MBL fold metallo-hydrolase [Desulfovibrionaceae bacterium]